MCQPFRTIGLRLPSSSEWNSTTASERRGISQLTFADRMVDDDLTRLFVNENERTFSSDDLCLSIENSIERIAFGQNLKNNNDDTRRKNEGKSRFTRFTAFFRHTLAIVSSIGTSNQSKRTCILLAMIVTTWRTTRTSSTLPNSLLLFLVFVRCAHAIAKRYADRIFSSTSSILNSRDEWKPSFSFDRFSSYLIRRAKLPVPIAVYLHRNRSDRWRVNVAQRWNAVVATRPEKSIEGGRKARRFLRHVEWRLRFVDIWKRPRRNNT